MALPHNSALTRLRQCCFMIRSLRANYRNFGLFGHILREMVHKGFLPDATESSW
jgi:small subunit ribosomal protein S14